MKVKLNKDIGKLKKDAVVEMDDTTASALIAKGDVTNAMPKKGKKKK